MYRLSSIEDEVLQRVISNEMAAGFIRTFGVLKAVEHIVIGDFERGILKYLLDTYSGNDALHDLGDAQLTEIGKRVEKMYDELLDPEYEYTYDEFGEYLLHIFIEHAKENAFDVRESGYFDLNANIQENYSDVPMFASSSLSIKDELYLREMFGKLYDRMIEEDEDLGGEIDREEFILDYLRQASIFWCMSIDDTGDKSLIFWDIDFMFYDELGGASVFFSKEAKNFGFVMNEDEREKNSGSIKKKIGEE